MRSIERRVDGRTDSEAGVIRDYCCAASSARNDDGRRPQEAAGLNPRGRLHAIAEGLDRVVGKTGRRPNWSGSED